MPFHTDCANRASTAIAAAARFRTSPRGADGEVIATFHETDPPSVLVERGDRTVLGMRVRAASGAKYDGANLMYWEHQGEVQVTWMNLELKCKERK